MKEIICVKALKKSYGEIRVIDGLSFKVHKGEIFGLLGASKLYAP